MDAMYSKQTNKIKQLNLLLTNDFNGLNCLKQEKSVQNWTSRSNLCL